METSTIALQGLISRPTVSFLIATAVDVERDAILETVNPLAGRDRIVRRWMTFIGPALAGRRSSRNG